MSNSFDADITTIRRAARAAEDVADAVQHVSSRLCLDGVAAGMPSSASADTAAHLETEKKGTLSAWSKDARTYSDNLTRSADNYMSVDGGGADRLIAAGGRLGGIIK